MKPITLLLFLALFTLAPETHAQHQPQVGLRMGGNLAQLRGKDHVFGQNATDRKLGFTVGAVAEVPLNNKLSLQPELLYTQKGGTIDTPFLEEEIDGRFESDFTLNYVKLPVVLKYNMRNKSRVTPSLYAGPYLAYSVKRSIDLNIEGMEGDDVNVSFDADELFKRWDYGALLGVDFGYRIARHPATLGLRYNLGFANIFKSDALFSEEGDGPDELRPEARTHEASLVLTVKLF